MKKAYLLLLSGALIIGTFASCNKEDVKDVNDQNVSKDTKKEKGVTVRNGMIKFETMADFETVILKLHQNQNNEFLNEWESEVPEFTSMRTAANKLIDGFNFNEEAIDQLVSNDKFDNLLIVDEEEDIDDVNMMIDDDALATLVNDKAMVQIGKDVYKFRYNTLYKTKEGNEDKLDGIDSLSRNSLIDNGIESSPITRKVLSSFDSQGFRGSCNAGYTFGQRRRFKGKRWSTYTILTSTIVISTKHLRRKGNGRWTRNKVSYINTSAQGSITVSGLGTLAVPGPGMPAFDYDTDAAYVRDTVWLCVNASCNVTNISLDTYHGGRGTDSKTYECTIAK